VDEACYAVNNMALLTPPNTMMMPAYQAELEENLDLGLPITKRLLPAARLENS
jgi:hypothetical protein